MPRAAGVAALLLGLVVLPSACAVSTRTGVVTGTCSLTVAAAPAGASGAASTVPSPVVTSRPCPAPPPVGAFRPRIPSPEPALDSGCGHPGVTATISAPGLSDETIGRLTARLHAATMVCATVTRIDASHARVVLPGAAVARARLLLGRGSLGFVTWANASPPVRIPADVVDPASVPVSEGGACDGSSAALECIPTGVVPRPIGIDGAMLRSAAPGQDPTLGQRTITLQLNGDGAARLGQATADLPAAAPPQNLLAIFVDNRMLNDATVQQPLTSGEVQISGGAIATDPYYRADVLALLQTGPLPQAVGVDAVVPGP
ncbi:MAG TPA: hypothetical protein VG245_05055 [Candidatus Dormibacteraeota bacterium]|nr:hypothetical protein [Candidatus Dormibacteraeota bacterium]